MEDFEVEDYVDNIINRHKESARPLTNDDLQEIKKWIRLSYLFPNNVHRFIPESKKFHEKYGMRIFLDLSREDINKLNIEVLQELSVEPVNDKDFEFVGKGIIETISKLESKS